MLMRTTGLVSGLSDNILISQLAESDRSLVDPWLERIHLERGAVLLKQSDVIEALYFPETVQVSIETGLTRSSRIEVGLVGREGVVSWSGLLGCSRSTLSAVVQISGGTLLRISIRDMIAACDASPTLRSDVLRFADIITLQMAHAIVSHLRDPLERRLARWLLMRHDRVIGHELSTQHDEISANLGVRRASVTDALHLLEGDRIIRCYRGRIIIRDRSALEAVAGDAYGAAEAHYSLLIGPFGRSSPSAMRRQTDTRDYGLD